MIAVVIIQTLKRNQALRGIYRIKFRRYMYARMCLFVSARDIRIESSLGAALEDRHYFASSFSTGGEANLTALSQQGAWIPFNTLDHNQFLQIDVGRLMRVTKVRHGIRGWDRKG